jgi:UDP-N-acetylmuramoyl-tripeptide--D-alanyl-D-alanine ligase
MTKTLILGDMLEIGSESKVEHFKVGEKAAMISKANRLIAVGEEAAEIIKGANSLAREDFDLIHFDDVDQLLEKFNFNSIESELVYIKASNAIGLNKVVQRLKDREA